jgi:lysophospholipase L1-like esterase
MTHPRRRFLRPALGLAALGLVIGTSGCAAWRLSRSAELVRRSEPFQQRPAAPALRLLVVGDSTAVGTGASTPTRSVAGRAGQAYPRLAIENRAADGARHADVIRQLQGEDRFDVVLVQVGGNDVIRPGSLDGLEAQIDEVVRRARALAPHVVLMPCGNVGNAPFFFAPLSWWMTRRSRALHRFTQSAARRGGAQYVNLFHERDDDPFVQDPSLNASDGLHPGDEGYALWWQQLQTQAGMAQLLAAAR